MKDQIIRFLKEDEGVTAIEYGLIAGLISVAIILSVTDIGTTLGNVFTDIKNKLEAAFPSTP